MDTRRCHFPNYRMGDYFQPSPSHWPLSQIRSSVRSRDDSSDLETFEMDWVGYHGHLVPYQERTIRNLTGRSLEESFAKLKRKRSSSSSPAPPHGSEARHSPEPQYVLRKECPMSDQAQPSASTSRLDHPDTSEVARTKNPPALDQSYRLLNTDQVVIKPLNVSTKKSQETKSNATQHNADTHKISDVALASDSNSQRHYQKYNFEKEDKASRSCTHADLGNIAMSIVSSSPGSVSTRLEKTPQSPHVHSSHQRSIEVLASTAVSQSQTHIQAEDCAPSQQASLSQSTPLLPSEQSEDDNDFMNVDESFNPSRSTKVKKQKQKAGSHVCKLCDITFTRHFDLLRHNQKHQTETEEDMATRTCPKCDRILSRVDATKRHVDTIPESCNYLRRKQGLKPLPVMPAEHYDACREKYYKLAQERKKPKGRKKANPAA